MITANVVHRVFRISYETQTGSAFAIDVDGRQYVITARHIVNSIVSSERIGVYASNAWQPLGVTLVRHASNDIDISVLAADRQLVPADLPLEATPKGMVYGQEAFFLGFPSGIISKYLLGAERYPLPFVKRATVSSMDQETLLLDGHNNPGFSGGPVVFVPPGNKDFQVAGIVSGFQAVPQPVLRGSNRHRTDLTTDINTGIIVAHSITQATAIIHANPIGLEV